MKRPLARSRRCGRAPCPADAKVGGSDMRAVAANLCAIFLEHSLLLLEWDAEFEIENVQL
jgi:hypothetical protein